jgi:ketosteroid isomerase-like protein
MNGDTRAIDTSGEAAIIAILDARARALRAGDLDGMMANVAEDVVMFDVVEPLARHGKAESRARAAEWLASYDGPIEWEQRDLRMTVDRSVAFSHALSRVRGRLKSGGQVDMWFRTTLGFRMVAGQWRITHDHGSVPFEPSSGKALLALQPRTPGEEPASGGATPIDDMQVPPLTDSDDTLGG